MAYTTLRQGSSGTEVEQLQKKLMEGNYLDIPSPTGFYGSKTKAAVEAYQRDKGLMVDGIAGDQTLGSIYSGGGMVQPEIPDSVMPDVKVPSYRYDADNDTVFQQAMQKLEAAKENKPTYSGTFEQQLQQIYDQIMNRPEFSYDLNSDPLWQQNVDQHKQQGQMAMMDGMGQAAALTGGYGNTFAQRVGQQAYQKHLQTLNDEVPEFYKMALSRYNQEDDRLKEQFAITGELAADEYGKHQDAENRYWQGVDRAQAEADQAYDRGQSAWYTEQQLQQQADNTAYNKQQDAYDRLANLITSTGYNPSQEELAEAGMSAGQAAAYSKYYQDQNTPKYTYVDSKILDSWDNGTLAESTIKQIQNVLGVEVDGKWGEKSRAAAKKAYGITDPVEVYKHLVNSAFAAAGKPYDPEKRREAMLHSPEAITKQIEQMVSDKYPRSEIIAAIDAASQAGYISQTLDRYLRSKVDEK